MKINKYPDGTSYVELENIDTTDFTFKINSYEDLWHLSQFVEVANSNGIKPTITIPNLIDAQADRRFKSNQSFGLKLVLRFLNSLDVKEYKIFHPHNSEVVEMFLGDKVKIIDNYNFISIVLNKIGDTNNLILMSSDAGGFKPLMKLCDIINWKGETFSAAKARSWDEKEGTKFIQQIDRKDFGGKDILIVDDLSIYGGTFKGLSKLLRERNIGKLYLAVSHMTVSNLSKDPITNYFNKVFTTNSRFDVYGVPDNQGQPNHPKNLEVIKLF